MIIYRPHRGGLKEAMAKARGFETEEEMKRHIYKEHRAYSLGLGYSDAPFEIEDIVIDKENPHEDKRIGWHDAMYVCVKRYGNEDYMKKYGRPQCIGTCAMDYERNENE